MPSDLVLPEPAKLDPNADLETVLAAWQEATLRLEQTHEALRAEVRRLTEELEVKNRELARKNRLADLGQMASHIAHEVRNNLVPVTLYMSLLGRRIAADPQSVEVLDKIQAGFAALDATVNDLLSFTSDRDPHLGAFAVESLLEDVHGTLAPQLSAQSIETVTEIETDLWVTADRNMLRRAVLNLMLNAIDAMPEGGVLTVTGTSGAEGVRLRVADTGEGMSDDDARRVFEPFYTTKQGGTGLGLAIVYQIAEVHGGRIAAESRPDGGAQFTLTIPHPAEKAAA